MDLDVDRYWNLLQANGISGHCEPVDACFSLLAYFVAHHNATGAVGVPHVSMAPLRSVRRYVLMKQGAMQRSRYPSIIVTQRGALCDAQSATGTWQTSELVAALIRSPELPIDHGCHGSAPLARTVRSMRDKLDILDDAAVEVSAVVRYVVHFCRVRCCRLLVPCQKSVAL